MKINTPHPGPVQAFDTKFSGDGHGPALRRIDGGVLRRKRRARVRLRQAEGTPMSWIYLLSGGIAAAIFVYLVIVLLWPEKF